MKFCFYDHSSFSSEISYQFLSSTKQSCILSGMLIFVNLTKWIFFVNFKLNSCTYYQQFESTNKDLLPALFWKKFLTKNMIFQVKISTICCSYSQAIQQHAIVLGSYDLAIIRYNYFSQLNIEISSVKFPIFFIFIFFIIFWFSLAIIWHTNSKVHII